jgi:hypothetical protein
VTSAKKHRALFQGVTQCFIVLSLPVLLVLSITLTLVISVYAVQATLSLWQTYLTAIVSFTTWQDMQNLWQYFTAIINQNILSVQVQKEIMFSL